MKLEKQLLAGLIIWVGDWVIHFEDPTKYTATHKTGKSQIKMERTDEN